eukprot:6448979-Pyramimonas_sp.AAC.1
MRRKRAIQNAMRRRAGVVGPRETFIAIRWFFDGGFSDLSDRYSYEFMQAFDDAKETCSTESLIT